MEENIKKNNLYKNIMLVVITALITCIATTIVVYNASYNTTNINNTDNNKFSLIKMLDVLIKDKSEKSDSNNVNVINEKLKEINAKLNNTYIGELNDEKLIDGALSGYVSAVGDEYTEYLNKEKVKSLMEDVNGSYVGIGVYITQLIPTNEILVIGVINNSPAEKAGIKAGDIIKKVDDISYSGEEMTTASNKMRGEVNTKVKVTISRNNEEIDLDIIRESIKFSYISSEVLENEIGYIKLTAFEGDCAQEFKDEYIKLQNQGIKSLIIDLRNNGGGLVDQCLKIADYIVPKGATTLITLDKNKKEEISTSNNDAIVNVPVVILVNEYSASASEILTGAIKENTNATVIGKTTYGKGVIQGIFLLNDKETGLKVTIQEYFTPNHNKINKNGIKPDIEVDLPDELKGVNSIDKSKDSQLIKAIEHLSTQNL